MREITFDINPMAAPRLSRKDGFNPSPAARRYFDFRDQIKAMALQHRIMELPVAMGFIFRIPMPKSWSASKRSRYDGQVHQQKPDLDNLIKGITDSIAYKRSRDDSHVAVYLFAQKLWTLETTGSITLLLDPAGESIEDTAKK
jgi:Holliday junction resolvase RusA-like endonuclease